MPTRRGRLACAKTRAAEELRALLALRKQARLAGHTRLGAT
jgi:hypothetical protein